MEVILNDLSVSDYWVFFTGFLLIFFLLILSGRVSGIEVSLLSINEDELHGQTKDLSDTQLKKLRSYIQDPKKILALILISNNFFNVSIVILSTSMLHLLFEFSAYPVLAFVIEVVLVTLVILLIGEIIPKVKAYRNPLSFTMRNTWLLGYLEFCFGKVAQVLVRSGASLESRLYKTIKHNPVSVEELTHAINITHHKKGNVHDGDFILKNIISFRHEEVKNIMTPRIDIAAIPATFTYEEMQSFILNQHFTRFPVYEGSLDNIIGIMHIKDLLNITDNQKADWVKSILHIKPHFVSENKKIGDLLNEFRQEQIHIAIVADEYGGTIGLATLEDILEEIVGEIEDEFDEVSEDKLIEKIGSYYFIDGKLNLKEFFEKFELQEEYNKISSPPETLAGYLLDIFEDFPKSKEKIKTNHFEFEIIEIQNRRISSIKVKKIEKK